MLPYPIVKVLPSKVLRLLLIISHRKCTYYTEIMTYHPSKYLSDCFLILYLKKQEQIIILCHMGEGLGFETCFRHTQFRARMTFALVDLILDLRNPSEVIIFSTT